MEAESSPEAVSGLHARFREHVHAEDGKSVLLQELCVFNNHPVEYFEMVDRINALHEHLDPFQSDALSCKSLLGLIHSIS